MPSELHRVYPLAIKTSRLNNIYLAITTKCPLQCDHCYEWDALNKRENLSLDELKSIVWKFHLEGVSQIHLSGGEPLVKVKDIIELLHTSEKKSEFWVLTSGFNLTRDNAYVLKKAGLTGVMISLDHFDPAMDNMFRGFQYAYSGALDGTRNAIAAGLVMVLNLCLTKAFVTKENLITYMELAKRLGVSFVQFLEPRAVGHYKGKNVDLSRDKELIVEEIYMNYNDAYRDYPAICYHGYHQRRMGCHAAGNRSLYVDTLGDIHACPFCQSSIGNAISDDIGECMGIYKKRDVTNSDSRERGAGGKEQGPSSGKQCSFFKIKHPKFKNLKSH